MTQSFEIVRSCIACETPANLMATLVVIMVGTGLAIRFERRKLAVARARAPRS